MFSGCPGRLIQGSVLFVWVGQAILQRWGPFSGGTFVRVGLRFLEAGYSLQAVFFLKGPPIFVVN